MDILTPCLKVLQINQDFDKKNQALILDPTVGGKRSFTIKFLNFVQLFH
ncbi:hypothetical protein pb186bvf_021177 [Paramecium bursaria]